MLVLSLHLYSLAWMTDWYPLAFVPFVDVVISMARLILFEIDITYGGGSMVGMVIGLLGCSPLKLLVYSGLFCDPCAALSRKMQYSSSKASCSQEKATFFFFGTSDNLAIEVTWGFLRFNNHCSIGIVSSSLPLVVSPCLVENPLPYRDLVPSTKFPLLGRIPHRMVGFHPWCILLIKPLNLLACGRIPFLCLRSVAPQCHPLRIDYTEMHIIRSTWAEGRLIHLSGGQPSYYLG